MVDLKELLALNDFKNLDDTAMVDIAEHAMFVEYQIDDRLVAEKMSVYTLYILEGELDLQTTGGIHQVLSSESERAQEPIFYSDVPGHYGRCTKKCKVLQIDRAVIEKYGLQNNRFDTNIHYSEFETLQGTASLALFDEITDLFKSKSVTLPSLPEIALYINSVLSKDDVSTKKLAKIIQMDPVIAARVVQVANSSTADGRKTDSIQEAIAEIGLEGVRTIVMGVVLRDMFMPNEQPVIDAMTHFYEHSIRIGVICYELAKQLRGFDRDHAFLAGVMHDIGVVPILVVAERHPELVSKKGRLDAVLKDLKSYVGGLVLQQWNFSEGYIEVAKHAYNWNRAVEKPDYCDLVQVALLHSHMVGGEEIRGPELFDLPAFKRLGLDKSQPVNLQTLTKLTDRVSELIKMICK